MDGFVLGFHLLQLILEVFRVVFFLFQFICTSLLSLQFHVCFGTIQSFPKYNFTTTIGYNGRYFQTVSNGINERNKFIVYIYNF